MKVITFESEMTIDYPVGNNISAAIQLVKIGSVEVKKLINTDHLVNIWCRGSSGAILATLLASNLSNNCKICHVKKEGENSHCSRPNYYTSAVNIIIDDFISSGETLNAIWDEVIKSLQGGINILFLCKTSGTNSMVNIKFTPEFLIVKNGGWNAPKEAKGFTRISDNFVQLGTELAIEKCRKLELIKH